MDNLGLLTDRYSVGVFLVPFVLHELESLRGAPGNSPPERGWGVFEDSFAGELSGVACGAKDHEVVFTARRGRAWGMGGHGSRRLRFQ